MMQIYKFVDFSSLYYNSPSFVDPSPAREPPRCLILVLKDNKNNICPHPDKIWYTDVLTQAEVPVELSNHTIQIDR